ncbi:MAG: SDR family NAD(P)-dependent oxidoreductase [Bifidobacteriaceae bacterium]|jgi:NAD(P)-dependent dehydrogenase (short-subunit alcohol dehydrogenase family)|nr:SDR family NAD(P)-dependent oxidoreductase [Bifidobacteriaceae bacterium]
MRTVVITGASDGIGAAASEQLAGGDLRLVLVGRSAAKTKAVAARTGAEWHVADFEQLEQVRGLADALRASCDRIDVLANNAGGIFSGPAKTADGFEKTFQVNHLAPFLLTHLLLDRILEAGGAVVNTASIAARLYSRLDFDDLQGFGDFRPTRAYGDSKLANILFAKGLHSRYADQGLSAVAFHPGDVATNFASDTDSFFRRVYHSPLKATLIPARKGGANLAHFITGQPGRDWTSGEYYGSRRTVSRTNRKAYDPAVVDRHWQVSCELLGI